MNFAKIFDTKAFGQILVHKTFIDDDGERYPIIQVAFDPNMKDIGISHMNCYDPEQEITDDATLETIFQGIDEAQAIEMVGYLHEKLKQRNDMLEEEVPMPDVPHSVH